MSQTTPGKNVLSANDTSLAQITLRTPGSRQFKPKAGFSPAGIAVMVAAHGLLGYALVSGMATKAVEIIKKPLEATIVAEVKLPPPPPPPPPKIERIEKIEPVLKVAAPPPPAYVPPPDITPPPSAAPAIVAVQTTQAVAPPPAAPPVPLAPPAPTAPVRADMALVCPKQVKAEIRVRGGKVMDVRIISGPRAYHAAVRAALARYECSNSSLDEITATQDFMFKLE